MSSLSPSTLCLASYANYSESGEEPRAFLLPLLAQPHSSPLSHFVSYFVPLSEKMFDLQQKAETEGRVSEANVWKVLVSQVWAGLYGYCSRSPDLKEVCIDASSLCVFFTC